MNDAIFFSLMSPVFLFILIICVFTSKGNVELETLLRSCKEVSDLASEGVMIYAGISFDRRTDLHIIRNRALSGQRYRDEILRPIEFPNIVASGEDFMSMDGNCRPHRAHLVDVFLFEEEILRMEWPACSPDMNPIEHVWDILGRRVVDRIATSQTLQEVERYLLEGWDRIPQLLIHTLIDSIPQRC